MEFTEEILFSTFQFLFTAINFKSSPYPVCRYVHVHTYVFPGYFYPVSRLYFFGPLREGNKMKACEQAPGEPQRSDLFALRILQFRARRFFFFFFRSSPGACSEASKMIAHCSAVSEYRCWCGSCGLWKRLGSR